MTNFFFIIISSATGRLNKFFLLSNCRKTDGHCTIYTSMVDYEADNNHSGIVHHRDHFFLINFIFIHFFYSLIYFFSIFFLFQVIYFFIDWYFFSFQAISQFFLNSLESYEVRRQNNVSQHATIRLTFYYLGEGPRSQEPHAPKDDLWALLV